MTTTYSFDASFSALLAVASAEVARLHSLSDSIATSWIREATADEPVEYPKQPNGMYVFPSRDGKITFHVGGVPIHSVIAKIQVVRAMKIGNDETWVGRFINLSAVGWQKLTS